MPNFEIGATFDTPCQSVSPALFHFQSVSTLNPLLSVQNVSILIPLSFTLETFFAIYAVALQRLNCMFSRFTSVKLRDPTIDINAMCRVWKSVRARWRQRARRSRKLFPEKSEAFSQSKMTKGKRMVRLPTAYHSRPVIFFFGCVGWMCTRCGFFWSHVPLRSHVPPSVGWLAGCLIEWWFGCLFDWLVGWLVGRYLGWLIGWLVAWLVER